jgi:protoporphyrinogen IX oxidase
VVKVQVSWLLVFHLFGVIFWIGSLLLITTMLSAASDEVGAARERIVLLASQAFFGGCNIGAAITLLFGVLMVIVDPSVMHSTWLQAKLGLVVVLIAVHIRLHRRITTLTDDPASITRREFRVIHSLISLLLLAILALAVTKPF